MVFALLLTAGQAFAASRQVTVVVQPERLKLDGQFSVTFDIPNQCFLDGLPDSNQYQVVSKRSKKRPTLGLLKTSLKSPHFTRESGGYDLVLTYTLRPLKPGKITISPIPAHCGTLDWNTQERTVLVEGGPKVINAVWTPPAPKAPEEKDPLDRPVGIPGFSDKPAPSNPVPTGGADEPSAPVLLRTPSPPPEEAVGKKSLDQVLSAKRAGGRGGGYSAGVLLIVGGAALALLGLAVIVFSVPWNAMSSWWRERTKKSFARDPSLPAISIHREEGVIGGKYKITKEIGAGGMGLVYLARDLKLTRNVAVKKMRSELQFNTEQRQNFVREAMIISRLSHPYIVAIHEVIEQDGDIYMVFDFVDGKPLSEIIDQKKPLSLKYCQEIFAFVCQAIDFAHKNNVLHQDLKPSNIMVDANGFAKVMDFGLAREAIVSTNEIWGTLAYMAPERHMGVGTASADVYSLGVCLYEMLSGGLPFPGPEFQSQKENMQFEPLSKLRPDLPKGIDGLLAKALAPTPNNRTAGALQFLEELKKL